MASAHLRKLRDLGLVEQKGRGNTTYYVPTNQLLTPDVVGELTHQSNLPSSTGQVSLNLPSSAGQVSSNLPSSMETTLDRLKALPKGFPSIPENLRFELESIGRKTSPEDIKAIIRKFCSLHPLKISEVAGLLKRNPKG